MQVEDELARFSSGEEMVLTIGVFDGVHLGHKFLLSRLREQAEQEKALSGVVTFDQHPEETLSPESKLSYLTTLGERTRLLKDEGVDQVVVLTFTRELSELSPRQFVSLLKKHLKMRGLVIGPDFALGKNRQGNGAALRALGQELGFTVTVIPLMRINGETASSTAIRHALAQGDMNKVNRLIGRPFSVSGRVVSGAHRGEQLGYPTANLELPQAKALPIDGIYATRAYMDNAAYQSMTYIGKCPTFGASQRSFEVYILDYRGDLYGQELKVDFVQRLRGDKQFSTAEELKQQIAEDVKQGRAILTAGSRGQAVNMEHLLKRGVAEIIVEEEMVKLLKSGKKLRLKEGFDPSSPDIHLGHMVTLRKLRQFQELGHQIVLIVADWTAQIGDPSGMSVTRPMLSREQVLANAQTYMEQFFRIVDKEKTEVRWQSEWFGKFTLADVIQLTGRFTVAQLLAREDFSVRYSSGRPITMSELLYPLLQAYDSVAVQADIEFGGTDQKFNLLVGRELQSMVGQPPQQCFMARLLVGTDGVQKMSKSLGNYIGIAEQPDEIFGKVMSIPDNLILEYFELLTDVPDEELAQMSRDLGAQAVNPMVLKKRLGREIVGQLYSPEAAAGAEEHFVRVFQRREAPEEIHEYTVSFSKLASERGGGVDLSRLLVEAGMARSRSEASRLISQGGTVIDGQKVTSNIVPLESGGEVDFQVAHPILKNGSIIKVGKRRFARIRDSDAATK